MATARTALATAPPPRPSPVELVGGRAAAVLVPLYDDGGEAWVVLTRRSRDLRAHRGEVSFPGGAREGDESLWDTACREAHEEIGLAPGAVERLGELDHLSTVTSSSYISPFVGALAAPPEELVAQAGEVDAILHVPLSELLGEGVFREEVWSWQGVERPIWFFELVGDTVWGATAAMLRQLLAVVTGNDPY